MRYVLVMMSWLMMPQVLAGSVPNLGSIYSSSLHQQNVHIKHTWVRLRVVQGTKPSGRRRRGLQILLIYRYFPFSYYVAAV